MNKSFIKSITAAVAALTLVSACNKMGFNKDSHKCANGKCGSKKVEDSNKCGAANGCAAKNDSKSNMKNSKKAEAKKSSAKKQ